VIIEVWLSDSEPTLIRKSTLLQQLSVRKDPRSWLRCLNKDEIIIIVINLVSRMIKHLIHPIFFIELRKYGREVQVWSRQSIFQFRRRNRRKLSNQLASEPSIRDKHQRFPKRIVLDD